MENYIILKAVAYFIASYLIGSFPTSVVITRLKGGIDLSKEGSGNLGATNVARVVGKKFGVITLVIDALKGFVPVFIAAKYFHFPYILLSFIMIAPILGHCYSVYIKFKGGKGVATALGVFLAISPEAVIMAFIIFLLVVVFSRYISFASMVSAFFMPFLLFYSLKDIYVFFAAVFISILIIYKHTPNIKRLLAGNEHKIKL
jgi:glycerol-3-phosphate acyltransferase PlsY